MLEIVSAVATGLILFFSGLTFWYQFLRTPRSDIDIEFISRGPISTNSGGITFSPVQVQFSNQGDMEGFVESLSVSTELIDPSTGEAFDPPEEARFDTSIDSKDIGEKGRLTSGATDLASIRFDVRELDRFPEEFYVQASIKSSIRDNKRVYDRSTTGSFRFNHERE